METHRWRKIDTLFNAALTAASDRRAQVLADGCGTDPALRADVESLLEAHERSSHLDSPAFDSAQLGPADDSPFIKAGERIGRYTLVRVLGRGGTGVVYEARQDEPARTVALKVIRALPHLDDLTPRLFRREGQALARLAHPGIAPIYEAGHIEGLYYFAMERVQGLPLTEHADEHTLEVSERLQIMQRVCDAVQYAHQRGVTHRDLKPSNILVTEAGDPKVLDFGLARITEPGIEHTRLTDPGTFRGTLAYSSPEQVSGAETDTRSDVYSLGVVLFELLTGGLPYDLAGLPAHEAVRLIVEQPPRRLSQAAGPEDRRRLRGDLETIVAKSLEKEPRRRYDGVAALSDDIDRYLNGHPVLAHPPSAAYQLRKFIAKHKAASAVAALFLLVVSGFAVAMNVMYRESQRNLGDATRAQAATHLAQQEARAEAQRANDHAAEARLKAATAEGVQDFLVRLFQSATPAGARGRMQTARDLLDEARERLRKGSTDPLIRAALFHQIGCVYNRWGEKTEAHALLTEALELRGRHLPPGHVETLDTLMELAANSFDQFKYDEAERFADEGLRLLEAQETPDERSLGNLLFQKARLRRHRGDFAEAVPLYEECLVLWSMVFGRRSPQAANVIYRLGNIRGAQGDLDQAQELLEEALEIYREKPRADQLQVTGALRELGNLMRLRTRYDESEKLLREAMTIERTLLGEGNPRGVFTMVSLARTLRLNGKPEESEQLFRGAIPILSAKFSDQPRDRALSVLPRALAELGDMLIEAGRPGEAEPFLRQELDIVERGAPEKTGMLSSSHRQLGICIMKQGRFEDAEAWLLDCAAIERSGPAGRVSQKTDRALADLYQAWGKNGASGGPGSSMPPADEPQPPLILEAEQGEGPGGRI